MRRRKHLVEVAQLAGILGWLIGASAGILLTRDQPGEWKEMFVYSFIIPILFASFFYGRLGGLLVALTSSLVSGSLVVGGREMLQSPTIQRVMFQIVFFNVVALVTSGLSEREREAETRYQSLFEGVPVGLYRITREGQVLDANPALVKMLGYPDRESLLATNAADLYVDPGDRGRVLALHEQDEVVRDLELRFRQYDGTTIVMKDHARAVRDSEGRVLYYEGSLEDITARQRAEEEIRRRTAHLEALNAIIAAAVAAPDLPVLLETTLGYTLQALEAESGALWIADQQVTRGLPLEFGPATAQTAHTAGLDIPGPIIVADWPARAEGEPLAVLGSLMARFGIRASLTVPFLVEGRRVGGLSLAASEPRCWSPEEIALAEAVGRQLGGAAERLRLLEQTREQAQQVQQIISTVPEGVVLLAADSRILLANPAAREYLALLAGAKVGDTLTHLSGRSLAELRTSPAPRGLWPEVTVPGPPRRDFEMIARPIAAGPEAGGWVLVIRDVTPERELQQRIQQQGRLAAVGQMAGGIAHDFNNIIAVIVLCSQLLLRTPDLPAKYRERLLIILEQAKQATNLIRQILDFSRRSVLERQPLDLVPVLQEMANLLRRTLPEDIHVDLVYGPGEYIVNADLTRLQQVLLNLALNARDAMPSGGALRIELECLRVEDSQTAPVAEMRAGEWVRVAVADTGMGIPPEVLPHIFEPFFTTKAPGQGSGLGLAQVYGIVTQHEGYLDVATNVGAGTTFSLYLPALPVAGAAVVVETPILVRGRGETVLVVEDDVTTRAVLRDALEDLNYRVLEAANGQEALAVFERRGGEIALVLTDLVMPVMGGQALFRALAQRAPAVKVVALTGHLLEAEIERLRSEGLVDCLPKPLALEQLAQVVARALQEG
ncbi:MAG: PAS domain S-box protein [Chloroflexi bacterium]|nr:PAS domain S-box protein [Chloroflexota bacterium]